LNKESGCSQTPKAEIHKKPSHQGRRGNCEIGAKGREEGGSSRESNEEKRAGVHPLVRVSLDEAQRIVYDFFTKNGLTEGVMPTDLTFEEFLKQLEYEGGIEAPSTSLPFAHYSFKVGDYSLEVCSLDGSIQGLGCTGGLSINRVDEEGNELTPEEAKARLLAEANLSFEEAKAIALRFLEKTYPNWSTEEFDLLTHGPEFSDDYVYGLDYEFHWRRKERLPGYYAVFPTNVYVRVSPGRGVVHSYIGYPIDLKVKNPPQIDKNGVFEIAKSRYPSGFDGGGGIPDYPEPVAKPEVKWLNEDVTKARLLWRVEMALRPPDIDRTPFSMEEWKKQPFLPRMYLLVDANTGEIVYDLYRSYSPNWDPIQRAPR
jgi:hypothetical protein